MTRISTKREERRADMAELIHKAESFKIIGVCMEVHRQLGKGHNEIIYKDALEYEFKRASIPFAREMELVKIREIRV